jgi:hypothetical protein
MTAFALSTIALLIYTNNLLTTPHSSYATKDEEWDVNGPTTRWPCQTTKKNPELKSEEFTFILSITAVYPSP